jgi:hypothetical protein
MTITQALSIHYLPGADDAKIKLTTAEILKVLADHIEIYPGQVGELTEELIKLDFKTTVTPGGAIVWLLEPKV